MQARDNYHNYSGLSIYLCEVITGGDISPLHHIEKTVTCISGTGRILFASVRVEVCGFQQVSKLTSLKKSVLPISL